MLIDQPDLFGGANVPEVARVVSHQDMDRVCRIGKNRSKDSIRETQLSAILRSFLKIVFERQISIPLIPQQHQLLPLFESAPVDSKLLQGGIVSCLTGIEGLIKDWPRSDQHMMKRFNREERIEVRGGMVVMLISRIVKRDEKPCIHTNGGHQTSSTTLAFLTANPVHGEAFRLPRINLPPYFIEIRYTRGLN